MIYYRTHASRPESRPAELVGWIPPTGTEYSLGENRVGDWKVLGIVPPMVFAPPEKGWVDIGGGWEVAVSGVFDPMALLKIGTKWKVIPFEDGDVKWGLPVVLTDKGTRAYSVVYGGPDFSPMLTDEQKDAQRIAEDARACCLNGEWPDMPIRARWTARLLTLTYFVSVPTLGAIGVLSDALIASTLFTAAGAPDGAAES